MGKSRIKYILEKENDPGDRYLTFKLTERIYLRRLQKKGRRMSLVIAAQGTR
jgi:hypothetical protein